MRAITVARKPIEGSILESSLKHGCGSININACRIEALSGEESLVRKNEGGVYLNGMEELRGKKRSMFTHKLGWAMQEGGRWPANVIIQHLPECSVCGTKVVYGTGVATNKNKTGDEPSWFGSMKSVSGTNKSYSSGEGGSEVILNWICASGCPVRELDTSVVEISPPSRFFKNVQS